MKIIYLFILLAVFYSCTYHNEETLYPPKPINPTDTTPTCDTINVKYSTIIKPILEANCTSCHSPNGSYGSVDFTTYDGVFGWASDDGANSRIYLDVSHHPNGKPMPKDLPKLPDCQIAQIKKWCEIGAPNN